MIRSFILFTAGLFILASCNQNDSKSTESEIVTDSTVVAKDTAAVIGDAHYFWVADMNAQGWFMKKHRPVSADSLSEVKIINMLNETYPDVILETVKRSNDTLYLRIPKSNYLSRQMGSSGARAYLAEATYNLTEIEGVDFINFSFKEGDHATPGTYDRTDFVNQ